MSLVNNYADRYATGEKDHLTAEVFERRMWAWVLADAIESLDLPEKDPNNDAAWFTMKNETFIHACECVGRDPQIVLRFVSDKLKPARDALYVRSFWHGCERPVCTRSEDEWERRANNALRHAAIREVLAEKVEEERQAKRVAAIDRLSVELLNKLDLHAQIDILAGRKKLTDFYDIESMVA